MDAGPVVGVIEWLGRNDPVALMDKRGWTAAVAFASIGVTLVMFAIGQTLSLSREWSELRAGRKIRQMSYLDRRRCAAIKSFAKFLALAEASGSAYFVSVNLLLALYISPAPPPSLLRAALFILIAATANITITFMACGIRALRLFP